MPPSSSVTVIIGARVRSARREAGITRKQLGERADVSERYLNQLENGAANVSIGILTRVAEALAVELTCLLPPSSAVSADRPGSRQAGPRHPAHPAPSPLADIIAGMSLPEQEGAVAILERYLLDRRRCLKGVALLGLRGAGKSTIGGLFASRHGLPFLSVTREIEARAGMSLNDLFNLGGPDAYRTLENDVVRDLAGRADRIVLETAGGIVSNTDALDVILAAFKTVWLQASPEEHLARVIQQGDMRPIHGTPKALEHLKTLLAVREKEYARADCVLDTTGRTPEACVGDLEQIAATFVA